MSKSKLSLVLLFVLSAGFANAQVELKTTEDSISYALGMMLLNNIEHSDYKDIDKKNLIKGMEAQLQSDQAQLTIEQAQQLLRAYALNKQEAEANAAKAEGVKFLADNSTKEGVVVLPNGLQYKILKEGTGEKPVDGDRVTTHYTGKFIDGKVFDSSVERGSPATFGVNGVIKGWTEILKMMPVGSKWEVFIPYNLAYGERGQPTIPAYSTLIFEIELLEIEGK